MSNKGLSLSMTLSEKTLYTLLTSRLSILDGLVVMIRLSHSRERGSIPRRGNTFLPLPCLLKGNAGDLRSSLFPFFFLLFPATFLLPHPLAQNSCGIFRSRPTPATHTALFHPGLGESSSSLNSHFGNTSRWATHSCSSTYRTTFCRRAAA